MRRFAIFLVAIPVALVCARLGMWQLSRLQQRRATNAALRAAMAQGPIQLSGRPAEIESFHPAKGSGSFDYQRQLVVDGVSQEGMPGVIVVTPLMLDDSAAVLVERGWIASPDGRTVDLARLREMDSSTVEGFTVDPGPDAGFAVGADWPRHVLRPSPKAVAAIYPYRILPYLVRRTNPPTLGSPLRPVPLPELTEGPHLGYAMQWFFFAAVAVVGSIVIFRREGGRGKREE
jgi:surfeit locus 1 family protein